MRREMEELKQITFWWKMETNKCSMVVMRLCT